MAKTIAEAKTIPKKHTKEQLIKSRRYANRKDLLGAVLKDGILYSIEEADAAIKEYMKGKVK